MHLISKISGTAVTKRTKLSNLLIEISHLDYKSAHSAKYLGIFDINIVDDSL